MRPCFVESGSRGAPASVSERGIALVIVMISIFVLSILAGGFAYSMKVETHLARHANSETELEWLGRSAVECARWELAQQFQISQEPYDGLDQKWAGGQGGIGTSNSPLAEFSHVVQTETGSATWNIIDLERRANINIANEALLQQALMVAGVDAGQMTPIVNSILDWIDPDNSTRIQGAEKEYYESQTPSYAAKNGPLDDISELLLIKNVTPDLFWGPGSTNHLPGFYTPQNARSRQDQRGYTVGLIDLFTPLSDGLINVNTASAEVLQLIPGITREAAEGIASARSGEDDGSGLVGPYRSVDQIRRVPEVSPIMAAQMRQFCDVRSRTFQVQVDAQVGGYHRHFIGVLGRNNARDVQVLNFYWKD
jgi:general secretion pathway protein K